MQFSSSKLLEKHLGKLNASKFVFEALCEDGLLKHEKRQNSSSYLHCEIVYIRIYMKFLIERPIIVTKKIELK